MNLNFFISRNLPEFGHRRKTSEMLSTMQGLLEFRPFQVDSQHPTTAKDEEAVGPINLKASDLLTLYEIKGCRAHRK